MNQEVTIIVTVGPSSQSAPILHAFSERHVAYIRLNLSHTKREDIQKQLVEMRTAHIPIIIDTEGAQIRTGFMARKSITLREGERIRIYDREIPCSIKRLYIRPKEALKVLQPGNLISLDFNSALLKVIAVNTLKSKHFIVCMVMSGGVVSGNKAVNFDLPVTLPPYSHKDIWAVKIAKKLGIRVFTLSFMNSASDVQQFRSLYPTAVCIAKIETKSGVSHMDEIIRESDGVLLDRGDLSKEVPSETVPIIQKILLRKCKRYKKPAFVATHILESMCESIQPMKSEINDIVNTVMDGATGLVLTKETAVGRYPVITVNTLQGILSYIKRLPLSLLHGTRAVNTGLLNEAAQNMQSFALVEPHGGRLVNRFRLFPYTEKELRGFPSLAVADEVFMDAEQIAMGGLSPLEGFMTEKQLTAVLDDMRLPGGLPWTMPILLQVTAEQSNTLQPGMTVALNREIDRTVYATLLVEDVYRLQKKDACIKWFGTDNPDHPGVKKFLSGGDIAVGGKINLLRRLPSAFGEYALTPRQSRKIFLEKGWRIVVGFHTRNAIHRSHEFIQRLAMDQVSADGLFVHPVIGKKKKGDFAADIIIKSYELMMKHHYPKNKVVLGVYATYSRYAGPREAIFTAICRKNYGCSHFIVGRDHTGVGNFYSPWASHEIFRKFPDLGITPIFFRQVYYVKSLHKHVQDSAGNVMPASDKNQISGTQVRDMLHSNLMPPSWFMRPDITKMILREKKKGKPIFV